MVLEIILSIVAVAAIIGIYYLLIRAKVRESALGAIIQAESLELIGEKKMELAVKLVYNIVPAPARPFFTKTVIQTIIQKVFDEVEEYAKKQTK